MTPEGADVRTVMDRIRDELGQPLFPAAAAAARDLRDRHPGTAAILFYGSCLRAGTDEDKILDFYILADDLAAANGGAVLGYFNRLLPPNVFYRETPFEGRLVRSKYALMSVDGFRDAMRPDHLNPTFWARFAQPCTIAWSRDAAVEEIILHSVSQAVVTAVRSAVPVHPSPFTADELWSRLFQMTYGAELRSENAATKGGEIFREYAARYRALTGPALRAGGFSAEGDGDVFHVEVPASQLRAEARRWRWRRVQGKTLSALRLLKGAFTFSGGLDYLAWKIRRHSGVEIEIAPWQRRHPVIGGLVLMLRTRKSGAYR